jgi:hypothetical protein
MGISWNGNTCGAGDDSGSACGTTGADLYYHANITTAGMHTIMVTAVTGGPFVVAPLGNLCTTTPLTACSSSVTVNVPATGAYYWLVKGTGTCGEFSTSMN